MREFGLVGCKSARQLHLVNFAINYRETDFSQTLVRLYHEVEWLLFFGLKFTNDDGQ